MDPHGDSSSLEDPALRSKDFGPSFGKIYSASSNLQFKISGVEGRPVLPTQSPVNQQRADRLGALDLDSPHRARQKKLRDELARSSRGRTKDASPLSRQLKKSTQSLPSDVRGNVRRLVELSDQQRRHVSERLSVEVVKNSRLEKDKHEAVHDNARLKAQIDAMKSRLERAEGRVLSMEQRLQESRTENQRQRDLNNILSGQVQILQQNVGARNQQSIESSRSRAASPVGHGSLQHDVFHTMDGSSRSPSPPAAGLESPLLRRDMGSSNSLLSFDQGQQHPLFGSREIAAGTSPHEHQTRTSTINALMKQNRQLVTRVGSLEARNSEVTSKLKKAEKRLRALESHAGHAHSAGRATTPIEHTASKKDTDPEGEPRLSEASGNGGSQAAAENGSGQPGVVLERRERHLRKGALWDLPGSTSLVQQADGALVDLIKAARVDPADMIMRIRHMSAIQSVLLTMPGVLDAARLLASRHLCELFDCEAVRFYAAEGSALPHPEGWTVCSANSNLTPVSLESGVLRLVRRRSGKVIRVAGRHDLDSLQLPSDTLEGAAATSGEDSEGAFATAGGGGTAPTDPGAASKEGKKSSAPRIANAMIIPLSVASEDRGKQPSKASASTSIGCIVLVNKKPRGLQFGPVDEILGLLLAAHATRSLVDLDDRVLGGIKDSVLSRIMRLASSFSTSQSLNDSAKTLKQIEDEAKSSLRARKLRIWVTTAPTGKPAGGRVWSVETNDKKEPYRVEQDIEHSIAGIVLTTGTALTCESVVNDHRFNPEVDIKTGPDCCIVAVPLACEGRVVAVLEFVPSSSSHGLMEGHSMGWGRIQPLQCVEAGQIACRVIESRMATFFPRPEPAIKVRSPNGGGVEKGGQRPQGEEEEEEEYEDEF